MAEFANRRMEDKIPYLEHLKMTKLLTTDEIRSTVQSFTNHEYKIQRQDKTLDDVLKYIQEQIQLLDLIESRREEQNYFHKTQQIEGVIKTQINCLFGVAARRFHDNLEFWSARINFAKSQNWPTAVRKYFEEVTKVLGKRFPQLWIEASNYEWELNPKTGIDSARTILQLGLRDHPESEALYVSAFRLEVEYVNFLERHPDQLQKILEQPNGDKITNELALAKVIYAAAKKNCETTKDFFFKFFLALEDADPSKKQPLLEELKVDAEAAYVKENEESFEQSKKHQVETDILMKLQNFQLFFSNVSEALKALKGAEKVENAEFWMELCDILQSNLADQLKMKDWLSISRIPKSSANVLEIRLSVLDFYSKTGLEKAREWYQEIQSLPPSSPRLYLRMAEIEANSTPVSCDHIKKCYERAIQMHGQTFIEPWVAYIQFEKKYRPKANTHSLLFSRALRELNGDLKESFKIQMLKKAQNIIR